MPQTQRDNLNATPKSLGKKFDRKVISVTDNDNYISDRQVIFKDSFERANKQFYFHQQKMIHKNAQKQIQKQQQAIIEAHIRSRQNQMQLATEQRHIVVQLGAS